MVLTKQLFSKFVWVSLIYLLTSHKFSVVQVCWQTRIHFIFSVLFKSVQFHGRSSLSVQQKTDQVFKCSHSQQLHPPINCSFGRRCDAKNPAVIHFLCAKSILSITKTQSMCHVTFTPCLRRNLKENSPC